MSDTDSELREFATQVKAMRLAHKEFDKRGLWTLKAAAAVLETDVDRACERILKKRTVTFEMK